MPTRHFTERGENEKGKEELEKKTIELAESDDLKRQDKIKES